MAQAYKRRWQKKINVTAMARLFGKSRQWYYKSLQDFKKQSVNRLKILKMIQIARREMDRMGAVKLYCEISADLKSAGIKMGRDKFLDFLRKERLLVPKRKQFTRTTMSYHRFKKYDNLIADFDIKRPEQVWVSDITYIRTKQGFMYLSLVTDAYSKKIVGYNLSNDLKTESVAKALKRAIKGRMYPKRKLIHHSDRGFQYCSPKYTACLETNSIKISMTTKYDPYENAIAERVNGILKNEFYLDKTFLDEKDAMKIVKRSIEVYNTLRPHYSCELMVPEKAHIYGRYKLKKWSKKVNKEQAIKEKKEVHLVNNNNNLKSVNHF